MGLHKGTSHIRKHLDDGDGVHRACPDEGGPALLGPREVHIRAPLEEKSRDVRAFAVQGFGVWV